MLDAETLDALRLVEECGGSMRAENNPRAHALLVGGFVEKLDGRITLTDAGRVSLLPPSATTSSTSSNIPAGAIDLKAFREFYRTVEAVKARWTFPTFTIDMDRDPWGPHVIVSAGERVTSKGGEVKTVMHRPTEGYAGIAPGAVFLRYSGGVQHLNPSFFLSTHSWAGWSPESHMSRCMCRGNPPRHAIQMRCTSCSGTGFTFNHWAPPRVTVVG